MFDYKLNEDENWEKISSITNLKEDTSEMLFMICEVEM